MSPQQELRDMLASIGVAEKEQQKWFQRINSELDFARRMAEANPEHTEEWSELIDRAARIVVDGLRAGTADIVTLVSEAEEILAPMQEAASEYTIYCCGHAHIDMNWMWTWPETVSVCYDTFSTMDRLMDEFEDFHFSQSQVSTYQAMQQYAPGLFEKINKRVREGRWEVTASQWVEGDKNLACGEILCRHLLYSRRWLKQHMDLEYDEVKIDWEPDTFGHAWTLPGILQRGGISRYYYHRSSGPRLDTMASGETSQLYWWRGKDGSRILAFDDSPNGYNNEIAPHMIRLLFAMQRHTGLKKLLWIYGVGDHGGGPTRRHLRAAHHMRNWHIWPEVRLTTTDEFFSDAEQEIQQRDLELPVHDGELNFVFEGCYTSESRIKFANRTGENDLIDTEIAAVAASRLTDMEYPREDLEECWRRSMFIQFHDILPGSGTRETVEHAMGLFQENLANTGMIRARALRGMADRIDTSKLQPARRPGAPDMGLGAGVGNEAWWGGISTTGAGEAGGAVVVLYNPAPVQRDEIARVKVWNQDLTAGQQVVVRDSDGNQVPGQVLETGNYWGHSFAELTFLARKLPPVGYRAYCIEAGASEVRKAKAYLRQTGRPVYSLGYVHARTANPVVIGNELLEVTVCPESGGITSIIDRETDTEFVAEGEVVGLLEREQEAPHGMTAWQLGPITDRRQPLSGATLEMMAQGPVLAAVKLTSTDGDSTYEMTISLGAASRRIDFELNVNWLERGDPQTGVPALRASFPIAVDDPSANYEIPFGTIERETDGEEVPALNWADISGTDANGDRIGATLVNNSKYGHQAADNRLRLTLLRSSYDPDPLPELGRHEIQFGLIPHASDFDPASAIYAGYGFNHPIVPVTTTAHSGDMQPRGSALEILTENVMLGGLKKAEDSDGLIIRLYEFAGEDTTAQVRLSDALVDPNSEAVETDVMERPVDDSSAEMDGNVLHVDVPAYGIATVLIQQ